MRESQIGSGLPGSGGGAAKLSLYWKTCTVFPMGTFVIQLLSFVGKLEGWRTLWHSTQRLHSMGGIPEDERANSEAYSSSKEGNGHNHGNGSAG